MNNDNLNLMAFMEDIGGEIPEIFLIIVYVLAQVPSLSIPNLPLQYH